MQQPGTLDGNTFQPYGAANLSLSDEFRHDAGRPVSCATLTPPEGAVDPVTLHACALCEVPAASAPRLVIQQERHFDCPRRHEVALCEEHGAALRSGLLALHQLVFDWTHRNHADLYDGTRLVLRTELTCLGCNAALPGGAAASAAETLLRCDACGATNVLGAALGHPAIVRLA